MSDLLKVEQLSEDDFLFFKDIVYRETGIKLTPLKQALLQSRIMRRLRKLKLHSYPSYRNYLEEHYNDEIINFINVVTTNKTEFLREIRHFDFMKERALPESIERNMHEIRIWSAGCSTGEEPYSIAITCSDFLSSSARNTPSVKILATDIDTQVLEKGIAGNYSQDTIDVLTKQQIGRYFDLKSNEENKVYTVKDSLKRMVYFRRLNLLQEHYPMNKKFFIIFCRNVIIYFDKETQRSLFKKIHNALDDNGYLFIGHSENLSGINSSFKSIGHTIYQKV